jgi:hypothetical protein
METAFPMQGLMVVRQYFNRDTPQESDPFDDHRLLENGGVGTGIATGRTRIFFTGTGRPTPVSTFITC